MGSDDVHHKSDASSRVEIGSTDDRRRDANLLDSEARQTLPEDVESSPFAGRTYTPKRRFAKLLERGVQ
jgi:hypothetical protein